MENIGFIQTPDVWTDISTLVTIDSGTTYQLECRGIGYTLLQVSDSEPNKNDCSGICLDPKGLKIGIYKEESGKKLYIKTLRFSEPSYINIATVEE